MLAFMPFEEFEARFAKGHPLVVWTEITGDTQTPVSVMSKLCHNRRYCFLFESVEDGVRRGRYSILGLNPDLLWRVNGDKAYINRNARENLDSFTPCRQPPLASLRQLLKDSAMPEWPQALPAAASGLFGYMGYDMVRLVEQLPDSNADVLKTPDAIFMRPSLTVLFDAFTDTIKLIACVYPKNHGTTKTSAKKVYQQVVQSVENLLDILKKPDETLQAVATPPSDISTPPKSNMTRAQFCQRVRKAKDYIARGDIFQVTLAQRFEKPFPYPPLSLYRVLRRTNPSPYLACMQFDDFAIVCSSPEVLVRVTDDKVTIRPIAGTYARGANAKEDETLARQLLQDPKEHAEHLMLLDLARNDVGRVAAIKSVEVTDQFFIETTSHLLHITSNVEGKLAQGHDSLSALMAGFPAGTVSGAPKIRAMEIIDELEKEKRSTYAGTVGYFAANGDMDSCITLRTALLKNNTMYVQAGGGIVADSVPEKEYQESVNKAKALFLAAEIVEKTHEKM